MSTDDAYSLESIRSRLKLQIAAYKEQDGRFFAALGSAQVAYVAISAHGAIADCNAAAVSMFECNVAGLIGRPIVEVLSVEQPAVLEQFIASSC